MKKTLYPLSVGQKTIAYSAILSHNGAVNNIGGLLLIEDTLDFDLLAEAIKLCVKRNDALELRMTKRGPILLAEQVLFSDVIKQYFNDETKVNVGFEDFSGKTMEEMDKTITGWNSKPLQIYESPLYEFTMIKAPDGRQGVYSKIDHLATDAWMSMLLSREVMGIYYSLKRGEELPRPLYPFKDYLLSEQAYLNSNQYQLDREYWLKKFDTKPSQTYIVGKAIKKPNCSSTRYKLDIGKERSEQINSFCSDNKISPATVFNCLMGIYLAEFTNQSDITLFNAVMLRSTLKEKKTCGPLVNSIVSRIKIDENKSFKEFCIEQNVEYLSGMRHIRYPMLLFIMEIYKKYHIGGLNDVLVSFQSARIQTNEDVKFETKWYPTGAYAIQFTMNVMDMDNTGSYVLESEYQNNYINENRCNEIHKIISSIMEKGIDNPDVKLKNLK